MCITDCMKNSNTREENGMEKRNLLLLSVTTIIMLLLLGCSSEPVPTNENPEQLSQEETEEHAQNEEIGLSSDEIVGTWRAIEATITVLDSEGNVIEETDNSAVLQWIMTFGADGSFEHIDPQSGGTFYRFTGSYEVQGNRVTISIYYMQEEAEDKECEEYGDWICGPYRVDDQFQQYFFVSGDELTLRGTVDVGGNRQEHGEVIFVRE